MSVIFNRRSSRQTSPENGTELSPQDLVLETPEPGEEDQEAEERCV